MESDQIVFVVDDDPAVRESVAALVRAKGLAHETFESAEDFLRNFDREKNGCLVADVRMTGMNGLELQERLVAEGIRLAIVIITGYADVPMAVRAIQAGAVTFLEKPCQEEELWQAIRMSLDKEQSGRKLGEKRREIAARLASLSDAELAVMEKIIEGKPNKVIAAELDIGLRTAELRRAHVLQTMQADSLAELVRMAMTVDFLPPLSD